MANPPKMTAGSRAPELNNNKKGGRSDLDVYASTKTTAQLILDLGSSVSHIFTAVVLLQLERRDAIWIVMFSVLVTTVVLQFILAIGLLYLRLMKNEESTVPKLAAKLNIIFFWSCVGVALLEVSIAGLEKFGLGETFVDLKNGTYYCHKLGTTSSTS